MPAGAAGSIQCNDTDALPAQAANQRQAVRAVADQHNRRRPLAFQVIDEFVFDRFRIDDRVGGAVRG
jgi:hypothetical protein